jgi:hypothetical protein
MRRVDAFDVRLPNVTQRPRPFQPTLGSSMRPSQPRKMIDLVSVGGSHLHDRSAKPRKSPQGAVYL